jgi:decaprenylphospho-beta-D-ribofuranose 2-oxidase
METGALSVLTSYGGLHRSRCRRFVPANVGELRALFARARAEGRRVTLRGSGLAFDGQSLGDDWVFSLERFGGIHVDAEKGHVTVGPAATWGEIVEQTLRHDLLPPIVVTTSQASAGGTLASNGLGRFSQVYGKEADWVVRFSLLTPEGDLLECSRDSHPELFRAVVGGHGYLGVVVDATYRLLRIGDARYVRHRVHKRRSFQTMAEELLTRPGAAADETVTALVIPDGSERSLVFNVRLVASKGTHRLPGLAPKGFFRSVIEWSLRSARISRLMWKFSFRRLLREGIDYIDSIRDYLFFMDGNVKAKALGLQLKLPMHAIQQSFALPIPAEGSPSSRVQGVVAFLRSVNEHLARYRVACVFFDVLVIPKEKDSMLSSTRGFDGFLVSVAFEPSAPRTAARVQECMMSLSRRCLELGGRVHLTKNVYASASDLETMYGTALDEFFAQKARVDPSGVLCNGFLEKVSPERVAALRQSRPALPAAEVLATLEVLPAAEE